MKQLWLLLLVLLAACSPLGQVIQKTTAEELAQMTPEQVKAWSDAGLAWYACLQINGPPPAGSGSVILQPKALQTPIVWNNDCHPLPPK
jgi:hypothetical protein